MVVYTIAGVDAQRAQFSVKLKRVVQPTGAHGHCRHFSTLAEPCKHL